MFFSKCVQKFEKDRREKYLKCLEEAAKEIEQVKENMENKFCLVINKNCIVNKCIFYEEGNIIVLEHSLSYGNYINCSTLPNCKYFR